MNKRNKGLRFTSVLLIIFITLKLVGAIDWSWIWVLSPVWISFMFWLALVGILFILPTIEPRRKFERSARIKW